MRPSFAGDAVNPDDLPHGCHDDEIQMRVIVPAPNVPEPWCPRTDRGANARGVMGIAIRL